MLIRQFLSTQLNKNSAAIAIKDARNELTYQQLRDRVNQLANYLRKQGVKPDVLVGIYAERSIELAISVLAIIQAGGAYVPLDPAYPSARLASIIADTDLSLILTQSHLVKDLDSADTDLFILDRQWDEIAKESQDFVAVEVTSAHLAYIMYTSGSTGKPQGVQITRSQVECYLQALNQVLNIQPDDIYLHSASFSFSSSVRQLLLPLAQGAKVVITSKENTANLLSLVDLIKTENITVFDTVASVWNYIIIGLEATAPSQLQQIDSRLRLLLFSGGLLTSQLLNRVRSKFQQSPRIVNIYGQTETIGVCTYQVADDFSQVAGGYVPVGTPYPHNQLYVLDEDFQPVGSEAVGELYISGASLARGYLNNPSLNARKFIPNPFSSSPGSELLYKTGDLGRYLPDGNLEIVGRQDFQVKIRGMRVEIEEIETVLNQYPEIRQAAVVGKKDRSGEQIIVAYLVCAQSQIDLSKLRSFLKTKLTDYMMPSAFEILDALPLTPNHKLDRNRLPEPSRKQLNSQSPRDELELQLVKIWEKVLDVSQVGINDSFFDLGGHSLIALQLFVEIERIWDKRLLLATLFESPTIAALVNVIRTPKDSKSWSPLVLIRPEIGAKRDLSPLYCIHPLGGNLFDYHQLSKKLEIDRPIYGLQARGLDEEQQPLDRIEDMASYFIQAIQTVQPHGPYFLLGYSFGGIVAFEIARQLTNLNEKVTFLGLLDIRSPHLPHIDIPFGDWLNVQLTRLTTVPIKGQIEYFIDKAIHRKKMDYREEVASKLAIANLSESNLLKILDANIKAKENYQLQTYSGQASIFWSEYQDLYIDKYPDLGWGDFVTGGLTVQHIPGDHNTLMAEPHVRVLAEKLQLSILLQTGFANESSCQALRVGSGEGELEIVDSGITKERSVLI